MIGRKPSLRRKKGISTFLHTSLRPSNHPLPAAPATAGGARLGLALCGNRRPGRKAPLLEAALQRDPGAEWARMGTEAAGEER